MPLDRQKGRIGMPQFDDLLIQSPRAFAQSMPARLLASGLNINALRTNTLLRKDEWELLDQRVVEISANVLVAVADLRAMGLTLPLGGLGVLVSQYETISDMSDASVNMAAEADEEEDRANFTLVGIPVPIISMRVWAITMPASAVAYTPSLPGTAYTRVPAKIGIKETPLFTRNGSIICDV